MKLILALAFVAAIVAIGFCTNSGAQDAPEMGFTSASQALGMIATRWDDMDKKIDGDFLAAQKAASEAVKGADDADKSTALATAMDDLRMKRMDLGLEVLRTEVLHRDHALAGAMFYEDFRQRDRDQINSRNTARATAARKRIEDAYKRSRDAVGN